MNFSFGISRPLLVQNAWPFSVTAPQVGVAPAVALQPSWDKSKLITTFVISNPIAGASVYLGQNPNVTNTGPNMGLEIQAGTAPAFTLTQEGRVLYELMVPVCWILNKLNCVPPDYVMIPFKVFDLSNLFLISNTVGGTTVSGLAFPEPYL